jgi:hypothetical protein
MRWILIEFNPDIEFIIFEPPYPIMHYVAMRDLTPKVLDIAFKISTTILTKLASLPNVRLYDFRAVSEITHNLDNYLDIDQPSPLIDEQVLTFLRPGEHWVRATSDPMASLKALRQQVLAYPN